MRQRKDQTHSACQVLLLLILSGLIAWGNQPPTINFFSPPPGTVLFEGDNIQLQAQASDRENGLTKVEFYANGSLIGEDLLPPYSSWWSNVSTGVHRLQAIAVDDALARGTSFIVSVTVTSAVPRTIDWNPLAIPVPFVTAHDWNGTAVNWRIGQWPTIFHAGEFVNILAAGSVPIFIGSEGVPMPVSPAGTTLRGAGTFRGGDILTGGVTLESGAQISFSNSTISLSFPGGTLIQPNASLLFDVSAASPLVSVRFGTGPITINGNGAFWLRTGEAGAVLDNDFVIRSFIGAVIEVNRTWPVRPVAVARFSGILDLGGPVVFRSYTESVSPGPPNEWSGPVVLQQDTNRVLRLSASSGSTTKRLVISGDISDGPGEGTNALRLSGPLRIAGTNNTYAHGTRIEGAGPQVEVAPESSLGPGDLVVEGPLRLLGSRNLSSNANVVLVTPAYVSFGNGVKIRIKSLRLGPTLFTNAVVAGGSGSFRMPPTNLNPTVALTNPPSGATFVAGDTITLRANASDTDSYISHIEFRLNDMPFAARTNAPFQVSLRSAPAGRYRLQAIAYDDDGGSGSSEIVTVNVQPRIDLIQSLSSNLAILEFDAPLLHPYVLEAADNLDPTAWTNILNFPPETTRRRIRLTNAIPDEVDTRFYRLLLP